MHLSTSFMLCSTSSALKRKTRMPRLEKSRTFGVILGLVCIRVNAIIHFHLELMLNTKRIKDKTAIGG